MLHSDDDNKKSQSLSCCHHTASYSSKSSSPALSQQGKLRKTNSNIYCAVYDRSVILSFLNYHRGYVPEPQETGANPLSSDHIFIPRFKYMLELFKPWHIKLM